MSSRQSSVAIDKASLTNTQAEEAPQSFGDATIHLGDVNQSESVRSHIDEHSALKQQLIEKLGAPSFKALNLLVKLSPNYTNDVKQIVEARREVKRLSYLNLNEDEQFANPIIERAKSYLPIFEVLASLPQLRPILEHAIDFEAGRVSSWIKKQLIGGAQYVPVGVLGAGQAGAAFNSEFIAQAPNGRTITIDQFNILGGQFRRYGAGAFSMNSGDGSLKEGSDTSEIFDFNGYGENSLAKIAHASGRFYPDNSAAGLAAAFNQYVSSDTMLSTDIESLQINSGEGGMFNIDLIDNETKDTFALQVDRLVPLVGVGEETYGIESPDAETLKIIAEERAKPILERQLFLYGELLSVFGDPNITSPRLLLAGKVLASVGGGHGAMTIVEGVMGLNPGARGVPGQPKSILLLSSPFKTREEFLEKGYERYSQVASFFPSKDDTAVTEPSLIKPLSNVRMQQLRRGEDGKLIMICTSKDQQSPFEVPADAVVATVGYVSGLPKLLEKLHSDEVKLVRHYKPDEICEKLIIDCADEPMVRRIDAKDFDPSFVRHDCVVIAIEQRMDGTVRPNMVISSPKLWLRYLEQAIHQGGCILQCESGTTFEIEAYKSSDKTCKCKRVNDPNLADKEYTLEVDRLSEHLSYLMEDREVTCIRYPRLNRDINSLPAIMDNHSNSPIGRFGEQVGVSMGGSAAQLPLNEEYLDRAKKVGAPINPVALSPNIPSILQLSRSISAEVGHRKSTLRPPTKSDYGNLINSICDVKTSTMQLFQFGLLRAACSNPTFEGDNIAQISKIDASQIGTMREDPKIMIGRVVMRRTDLKDEDVPEESKLQIADFQVTFKQIPTAQELELCNDILNDPAVFSAISSIPNSSVYVPLSTLGIHQLVRSDGLSLPMQMATSSFTK